MLAAKCMSGMWPHPKQSLSQRRGETLISPLPVMLVPERRILVYVIGMMAGIAFAADMGVAERGATLAAAGVAVMSGWAALRGRIGGWHLGPWYFAVVMLAWCSAGMAAGWWQLGKAPQAIDRGLSAELAGTITAVDGRFDHRLRIWLSVSDASSAPDRLRHHLVRLSVKPQELAPKVGSRVVLSARVYPPPPPVLHGARDHGVQARIRGVVASGYVTAVHSVEAPDHAVAPFAIALAALRQTRADMIVAGMTDPAGGIAAALLIGDRRYVSDATYDMFRQSGLAHLLAISGLHMGLLCFGVIGFLRALMALWPVPASWFPVHKYAALAGIAVGLAYVLLSGLSVSAIRAFLMAMLILAAWLVDRLGLTLRNVGLAAGVILLANPFALFSAGFQLSFAATTALVIWFEGWRHRAGRRQNGGTDGSARRAGRPMRWVGDLILASCLASAATLPLTAQHFGTITPWGVLANLAGIPLTGLWIMPAGLLVLATQFLPVPDWLSGLALWVMQLGIDMLVMVAGLFADLPASPLRVPPPGAMVLVAAGVVMATAFCLVLPLRLKVAGWFCAAAVVTGGMILPARDDGVLLARGEPQLVLASVGGKAAVYATSGRPGRQLSGFLADSVGRQLAQPVSLDLAEKTGRITKHRLRDGRQVAIVTSRRDLSRACRQTVRMVISLVVADYPCRSDVPLVSLAGLPRGNYRLSINDRGITARASNGQYLRINPVSRP